MPNFKKGFTFQLISDRMFEKKCPDCGKKIEKKFRFCPFCGSAFKSKKDAENYGMLGRDDFVGAEQPVQPKLPFGLNKIMGSLVKQLNKELSGMGQDDMKAEGMPRGFQIKVSTGNPQIQKIKKQDNEKPQKHVIRISEQEAKRRGKLKRAEAKSTIKRLGDVIIYEISTPGVSSQDQVVISKLEDSLEVKAYSKDKCYYKTIPLKVEILRWGVAEDKVVVELKG